jgi:phosphoglycolate phosphatase-like HAD superfamily hydrolase
VIDVKARKIRVVAFDFDGTLVESNHIKDQAFETIFGDWPDHKETIMAWHLPRNNTDREEKFRYFVEEILGQKTNRNLIDSLIERFTTLTRQSIIKSPWVEGAQAFLDYFTGKVPLFLVSATPQNELKIILKERNLNGYFQKVYGAPIKKVEVLKTIILEQKALPSEILYIGDSPEDQQAAESLDIYFIGRRSDRVLSDSSFNVFPDFLKIKEYFNSRYEF